jgi:hypothetical protein
MYRGQAPTLAYQLEATLSPHRFAAVEPSVELVSRGVTRLWHRKTWNTNRGVVLASPGTAVLGAYVDRLRHEAGGFLGSSWWSQLGLQVVLELAGDLPSRHALDRCVDKVNTQGILVQSVFAVDAVALRSAEARTWGQLVTGKFQDAIADAIAAFLELRAQG